MAVSTIWWVLAGLVVAMELISGTFFLLMLATGLVGGALAAHLGLPLMVQVVLAAAVGGGALVALYAYRRHGAKRPSVHANQDVQMDIGATVFVEQWNLDATASVQYRGARWTVVLADPQAPCEPGLFRIEDLTGNRLVLSKL